MRKEPQNTELSADKALHIAHVSHKLLQELRQTYLVNVDNNGQPKAPINVIIDLWDRVNKELRKDTNS